MNDYFLKASDESSLYSSLEAAEIVQHVLASIDEDGNVLFPPCYVVNNNAALDAIGNIPDVEGFHANLRCDALTEEQIAKLPIISVPANPVRVWA